jgi:hypothetical protein
MFRFTIRDVLWLMFVVAILAAWWAEHREFSDSDREVMRSWRKFERQISTAKQR